MAWLLENWVNLLVGGVVLALVIWSVVHLIRQRKKGGCPGCSGCCGSCSGCEQARRGEDEKKGR